MKELLKQLAAYNIWAHQRITDVILSLPEEKQMTAMPSSFNGLYRTVLHLWDAESCWWQRMKLNDRINNPSENFKGSMRDAVNGLLNQSRQWKEWVNNASDMMLDHVFQYQLSRKEYAKLPIYQMLVHVFNHATYHRGQLINILRQLGIEKLPETDFDTWCRRK